MKKRIILILIYLLSQFWNFSVSNAEDWMPDVHLRQAVREELGIPDKIPIHPGDMAGLQDLILIEIEHDIESLRGLEYAVNLKDLIIDRSQVSDLTPLAGLENLGYLAIVRSQVSDLAPLAGLKNLRTLKLYNNRITDITPLAGLINLKVLQLQNNQIEDISPLAGLVNLKELNLLGNQIVDFTPIYGLVGIETLRLGLARSGIPIDSDVLQRLNPVDGPVVCEIARDPIRPRMENREFPSVFQACQDIINMPRLSWEERMAYHDLFFCRSTFGWTWTPTPDGNLRLIGDREKATIGTDRLRAQNPNLLLLTSIEFYAAYADEYPADEYPEDSPYFLRDESGNRLKSEEWDHFFLDFTHPAVQERVIQQAIEVAKCGIFDGIAIDHWGKAFEGYITVEEADTAKDRIIQGIRDAVDEDFLILVTTTNTIGTTIPRHAEYINGVFMETIETYEGGYTYAGLFHIESTLSWAEENLREPQINCLAGRGVRNEPLGSPRNLQWMRLFTTMSLTHSDGYVLFTLGSNLNHSHTYEMWPGHADEHAQGKHHSHQQQHYWYDFWDAPLGQPVGGDETKAQFYEEREGLFIREFTNGWAVYNRSGVAQTISLSEQMTGVSSQITDRVHTIPDLDGEMYLRVAVIVDVNGDGVVNILDLVIVANAFGEATPDVNGDGIVNILDLVIVANAFE